MRSSVKDGVEIESNQEGKGGRDVETERKCQSASERRREKERMRAEWEGSREVRADSLRQG